jgi:hypothetical protein
MPLIIRVESESLTSGPPEMASPSVMPDRYQLIVRVTARTGGGRGAPLNFVTVNRLLGPGRPPRAGRGPPRMYRMNGGGRPAGAGSARAEAACGQGANNSDSSAPKVKAETLSEP